MQLFILSLAKRSNFCAYLDKKTKNEENLDLWNKRVWFVRASQKLDCLLRSRVAPNEVLSLRGRLELKQTYLDALAPLDGKSPRRNAQESEQEHQDAAGDHRTLREPHD